MISISNQLKPCQFKEIFGTKMFTLIFNAQRLVDLNSEAAFLVQKFLPA